MRSVRWAVAATAAAAFTAGGAALAAVPAQAASRTALPHSRPAWATASALSGKTAGSSRLGFRVYLGWRSDPSSLIQAVTTPGSSQYHHYLTPAQFRAQFAPSAADVSSVTQWLKSSGFSVNYTPANNLYVSAQGTVAQVNAAFNTTIGNYSTHGMSLRAPETTPSVPSSLPNVSVVGLDDSAALVHTNQASATPGASPSPGFKNAPQCGSYWGQYDTSNLQEPTPLVTSNKTITSPSAVTLPNYPNGSSTATNFSPCGYTPSQLRSAYGLTNSNTGAGQTVAIIDAYASPTIVSDANTYFAKHNVATSGGGTLIPQLSSANFTQEVAPGTYNVPQNPKQDPQGWYGEETLDIEAVHSMAPAAHIVFVGAPNNYQDLDAALNHVVDKHLASMVSNSYGWSGESLPPGFITPVENILQEAAATGIGVYFSSGDSGDETGGVAGATPSADWPASSPYVTAVGGTSLAVDSSGSRTGEWGWETGRATLNGASMSWNAAHYQYGSGGGVSRLFGQPSYQAGVVPASMSQYYGGSAMRVVPDVAALGDPTTGMLVGQTQSFPDGTYYSEYRIGGTSLASPLFTGMMADVQAQAGTDIGFANPLVYAHASAFRDILPSPADLALVRSDYVNSVDASKGYAATARLIGDDAPLTIHVGTGYDDVTGVGSPNGQSWIGALGG